MANQFREPDSVVLIAVTPTRPISVSQEVITVLLDAETVLKAIQKKFPIMRYRVYVLDSKAAGNR